MADYTEKVLSENFLDQLVNACRYALKELNCNIKSDYGSDNSHSFFAVEKWRLTRNRHRSQIYINIVALDKGTELTIHVEVPGDFLGPWMKNQCRNVAKNFINNVKFAENSFPNTVRSSFKGDELKVEAKNEISSFLSEAEIEKLIGKVSFKKKVDEIKKVIEKVGKKDKFLLDLLYESYLEWVPKIAKNYIDQGLSFEDLVKGGSLGLRSVVDKIEVKKRMNLEKQSYIAVWGINFYIVKRINLLRSTSDFEPSVHNEPESSTTNILKSDSKANELISETEALKKFAELKDQGIITEEEFNTKKKQILGL